MAIGPEELEKGASLSAVEAWIDAQLRAEYPRHGKVLINVEDWWGTGTVDAIVITYRAVGWQVERKTNRVGGDWLEFKKPDQVLHG